MSSPVLASADALVGVPYVLHGDSPDGWDCLGCVRWVRKHLFGRETPIGAARYGVADIRDPARVEAKLLHGIDTMLGPVWRRLDAPAPGALVLFERMRRLDHVGVMLNERLFLHAQQGSDTVPEDIRGKWAERQRGFYELA